MYEFPIYHFLVITTTADVSIIWWNCHLGKKEHYLAILPQKEKLCKLKYLITVFTQRVWLVICLTQGSPSDTSHIAMLIIHLKSEGKNVKSNHFHRVINAIIVNISGPSISTCSDQRRVVIKPSSIIDSLITFINKPAWKAQNIRLAARKFHLQISIEMTSEWTDHSNSDQQ